MLNYPWVSQGGIGFYLWPGASCTVGEFLLPFVNLYNVEWTQVRDWMEVIYNLVSHSYCPLLSQFGAQQAEVLCHLVTLSFSNALQSCEKISDLVVYNSTLSLGGFCKCLISSLSLSFRLSWGEVGNLTNRLLCFALQRRALNRWSWTLLSLVTDAVTCHSPETDARKFPQLFLPGDTWGMAQTLWLDASSVEFTVLLGTMQITAGIQPRLQPEGP